MIIPVRIISTKIGKSICILAIQIMSIPLFTNCIFSAHCFICLCSSGYCIHIFKCHKVIAFCCAQTRSKVALLTVIHIIISIYAVIHLFRIGIRNHHFIVPGSVCNTFIIPGAHFASISNPVEFTVSVNLVCEEFFGRSFIAFRFLNISLFLQRCQELSFCSGRICCCRSFKFSETDRFLTSDKISKLCISFIGNDFQHYKRIVLGSEFLSGICRCELNIISVQFSCRGCVCI